MPEIVNELELIEKRVEFLKTILSTVNSKEQFNSFLPIFEKLEEDWERIVVPTGEKKKYEFYNGSHSVKTTLGRILKRQYKMSDFKDNDMNTFITKLNARVWPEPPNIKIYTGEDIVTKYASWPYNTGNMGSCMTSETKRYCTRLYAENPDNVALYVFETINEDEMALGRTIVWTLEDGRKLVDRIYSDNGVNGAQFKELLEERGCICKTDVPINELNAIKISLNKPSNGKYPYMDTFQYAYYEGNKVVITKKRNDSTTMMLTSDSGEAKPLSPSY